jgi:predicted xylose isomerase-like sugar epimerase
MKRLITCSSRIGRDLRSDTAAFRRAALGVTRYVEPLGMHGSTMRRHATAAAAVSDIAGWDAYGFVTIRFSSTAAAIGRCSPRASTSFISPGSTGTDLPPDELTEPDRGLVEEGDRVGNIHQLKALTEGGYPGISLSSPSRPESSRILTSRRNWLHACPMCEPESK